jgi:HEAT repeat protein
MAAETRALVRMKRHIANLGDPELDVAARAERYLAKCYGDRALDLLIEACDHPNPKVRCRAVWALGRIQNHRAYDTILRLTNDPDAAPALIANLDTANRQAWRLTVSVLGSVGDEEAVEALTTLLPDADAASRVDLQEALDEIAERRAGATA